MMVIGVASKKQEAMSSCAQEHGDKECVVQLWSSDVSGLMRCVLID